MINCNYSVSISLTLFILLSSLVAACGDGSGNGAGQNGTMTGKAGSTARFAINGDYLYALTESQMQLFDIKDPRAPKPWTKIALPQDVETIFPYESRLFLGSQTGMHVFDNQDPANPVWLATMQHGRSCDPVIVEGRYAYVTLRSGNSFCPGATNQLDVIDVGDGTNPTLIQSYPMQNPNGLGMVGSKFFVCDGEAGLKVFNAEGTPYLEVMEQLDQEICIDVIALAKTLIVTGQRGIVQYSHEGEALEELSVIPIVASEP